MASLLVFFFQVFVGRRSATDRNAKKRFLPHDPRHDKPTSSEPSKRRLATSEPAKRRIKIDNNQASKDEVDAMEDDDSSGFDSAVSSNQDCLGSGAACDSPAARTGQTANHSNRNNQEAEFNAILHHLVIKNVFQQNWNAVFLGTFVNYVTQLRG